MADADWQDLHDKATDTRMRVSPEVLQRLGYKVALQIALDVKAKNPPAARQGGPLARGYRYTAGGTRLVATVFLLAVGRQRLPVVRISTLEEWAEFHQGMSSRIE